MTDSGSQIQSSLVDKDKNDFLVDQIDVFAYLKIFSRYKKIFLVSMLIGALGGLVLSMLKTYGFRSEAVLFGDSEVNTLDLANKDFVSTINFEFRNPEVMSEVFKNISASDPEIYSALQKAGLSWQMLTDQSSRYVLSIIPKQIGSMHSYLATIKYPQLGLGEKSQETVLKLINTIVAVANEKVKKSLVRSYQSNLESVQKISKNIEGFELIKTKEVQAQILKIRWAFSEIENDFERRLIVKGVKFQSPVAREYSSVRDEESLFLQAKERIVVMASALNKAGGLSVDELSSFQKKMVDLDSDLLMIIKQKTQIDSSVEELSKVEIIAKKNASFPLEGKRVLYPYFNLVESENAISRIVDKPNFGLVSLLVIGTLIGFVICFLLLVLLRFARIFHLSKIDGRSFSNEFHQRS